MGEETNPGKGFLGRLICDILSLSARRQIIKEKDRTERK